MEEAKKVGLVDGDGRSLWETSICVVQCPPISTLEGFVCAQCKMIFNPFATVYS